MAEKIKFWTKKLEFSFYGKSLKFEQKLGWAPLGVSIWETACLRIKLHKLKQPSIKHIYEAQIKSRNKNMSAILKIKVRNRCSKAGPKISILIWLRLSESWRFEKFYKLGKFGKFLGTILIIWCKIWWIIEKNWQIRKIGWVWKF